MDIGNKIFKCPKCESENIYFIHYGLELYKCNDCRYSSTEYDFKIETKTKKRKHKSK